MTEIEIAEFKIKKLEEIILSQKEIISKYLTWQEIKTAPKTGEIYLGIISKNGIVGEAFTALYDEDEGGHICQFKTEGFWHKPTHWIPLPKMALIALN